MPQEATHIPKLRFPEFEGEWDQVSLKEKSSKPSYGLNAAATTFDGKHKYIRITDIDEESRLYSPSNLTSPEGEISPSYKLEQGDLLFARTGASVGKTYLYNPDDGDLYFAGFLIRFRLENCEPHFVFSHTLTYNFRKWVSVMSMRSGQPGINAEEYSTFKFYSPKLLEQQKIATFLTTVDQKIEKLQRKKDLLTDYKKGMMQKLFSQEIRFKDEDGKDFPEWEEKKLGEIATKINSKNTDNSVSRVLTNSAINGVIDQSDYFDHDVANAENLGGYYVIEKGDFVYNPRVSVTAPVGPIKRNNLGKGVMSPLYTIFRFASENSDFLNCFFSSSLWHKYMKQVANYGARYDRMAISSNDFLGLPIPLPHPAEQQKIATYLTALDQKIELVDQKLIRARAFKKGLLQQMFV